MRTIIFAAAIAVLSTSAEAQFAKRGEWITRPDGTRVCKLEVDLQNGMIASPRMWCGDWQEPIPYEGTPYSSLSWARLGIGGRPQFLIEGRWRP